MNVLHLTRSSVCCGPAAAEAKQSQRAFMASLLPRTAPGVDSRSCCHTPARHHQLVCEGSQPARSAQRSSHTALAATATAPAPAQAPEQQGSLEPVAVHGIQHNAFIVENLEASLRFYDEILGCEHNPDRPADKLPYRGVWLMVGPDMIHLMELPDPDPKEGRPAHGGKDRHICLGVPKLAPLEARLSAKGVEYSKSKSGRQALFFRDPDMNVIEVAEMEPWR